MANERLPKIEDFGVCLNLAVKDCRSLPNCRAVYVAYVPTTQQVLYIGKTQALRDRWRNKQRHRQIKDYIRAEVRIAWFPLRDENLINKLEWAMIRQYQPIFNIKGTDPNRKNWWTLESV